MNRRGAVAAMASIIAAMTESVVAEAQEPVPSPVEPTGDISVPMFVPLMSPVRVQFDLAAFEKYVFTLNGETVTVTPAEMFEALREGGAK